MEEEKLIQISTEQILTHSYNTIKPNEVLIFQHKGTLRSRSWPATVPFISRFGSQEAEVRGSPEPGSSHLPGLHSETLKIADSSASKMLTPEPYDLIGPT